MGSRRFLAYKKHFHDVNRIGNHDGNWSCPNISHPLKHRHGTADYQPENPEVGQEIVVYRLRPIGPVPVLQPYTHPVTTLPLQPKHNQPVVVQHHRRVMHRGNHASIHPAKASGCGPGGADAARVEGLCRGDRTPVVPWVRAGDRVDRASRRHAGSREVCS